MKKVILSVLAIVMVAVVGITLVACNTATTQGQLANLLNDHNHEAFVYDVYAKNADGDKIDGYNGTYTVTLDAYDAGSTIESFGKSDVVLSNVDKGVFVKGLLVVGTTKYETGCYFKLVSGSSYMVPAYSYRVQYEGETEVFRLNGSYQDKTFDYERWINGEKSTGSVGTKSTTYFDNNEFHQALRTITTFSNSLALAFATPLVSKTEATYVTLTAQVNGTTHVKNSFTENNATYSEEGIKCYRTYISRSTEVSGIAQVLYYATDNITVNGWNLKNVLVQIEEPFKIDGATNTMVYALNTASLS